MVNNNNNKKKNMFPRDIIMQCVKVARGYLMARRLLLINRSSSM